MARILVVLVLLTSSVRAEPEDTKSPVAAVAISGLATVAAAGVFAVGAARHKDDRMLLYIGLGALTLAPSAGHWYAEDFGAIGLVVRGLGATVATYALSRAIFCADLEQSECNSDHYVPALYLGGLAFVGGTIVDIVTAGTAARRTNARRFRVTPALVGGQPGLGFAGSF